MTPRTRHRTWHGAATLAGDAVPLRVTLEPVTGGQWLEVYLLNLGDEFSAVVPAGGQLRACLERLVCEALCHARPWASDEALDAETDRVTAACHAALTGAPGP